MKSAILITLAWERKAFLVDNDYLSWLCGVPSTGAEYSLAEVG